MSRHRHLARCCAALALFSGAPALAQRAGENVFDDAEDAFGTRVGVEGVGLYSSRDARGFDPVRAGNIRIEGLYFDQQAFVGMRLQRSQSMHVGISAQSYPFPAPTGIANTALIMPADKTIVSVGAQYQDLGGANQRSLDVSMPLTSTLGFAGGTTYVPARSDYGGPNASAAVAGLLRWRPRETIEIIPLLYYTWGFNNHVQPQIFPASNALPPAFQRRKYFGPDWASNTYREYTLGVIARARPFDGWRLETALFRSDTRRLNNHAIFYRNVQNDGIGQLDILSFPTTKGASTSGELRAAGVFTQGNYRHTVYMAVRGRDSLRLFSGAANASFGPATIGVVPPITEPAYVHGPRDTEALRQITPGVTYVGQWARVGEFSLGLQKSFYRRTIGREAVAATATTKSAPWLYNASVSVTPTPALAFYASYTRGLEEFGTAPDNAVNRGSPVPADITSQVDAGLRYRITPTLSLVAGVFEVKKPYYDRDAANVFTAVGDRDHQGIELSLTGQAIPGLTVVAGAVLIKARVTGSSVDRGLIGPIPPGLPPAVYTLSVQYGPRSWRGLSADVQMKATSAHYANRLDTFRVPASAPVDFGLRYAFKIRDVNATLRTQVLNILNDYGWRADGASGSLYPTPPRRYAARIAVDF